MALEPVDLVILVDDSDIDLFVQRRFIEISGFSKAVVPYQSSREALAALSSKKESEPALIFLDLNMPDMDGFQFLDEFEGLPGSIKRASKVVILTSSSSAADRERANHYPSVIGFVSKPLTVKGLEDLGDIIR